MIYACHLIKKNTYDVSSIENKRAVTAVIKPIKGYVDEDCMRILVTMYRYSFIRLNLKLKTFSNMDYRYYSLTSEIWGYVPLIPRNPQSSFVLIRLNPLSILSLRVDSC